MKSLLIASVILVSGIGGLMIDLSGLQITGCGNVNHSWDRVVSNPSRDKSCRGLGILVVKSFNGFNHHKKRTNLMAELVFLVLCEWISKAFRSFVECIFKKVMLYYRGGSQRRAPVSADSCNFPSGYWSLTRHALIPSISFRRATISITEGFLSTAANPYQWVIFHLQGTGFI